MLFSELVAITASSRKVADDGLSPERAELRARANSLRLRLARYLSRFKHHKRRLAVLDVRCHENPDLDAQPDEACVHVTSDDPRSQAVARAAFAAGFYFGQMNTTFHEYLREMSRDFRRKQVSNAGGEAKKQLANESHAAIRVAYARWAAVPENANDSVRSFAEALSAKKARRKVKGFSRATIQRVVDRLHEEILGKWKSMGAGSMPAAKRDRLVADAMQGRTGVTLATVRRALA